MRKYLPYLFAAILAFSTLPASAAAHPQKPGKWQTKIEMEMPGMPMKLPPMTLETCVTEDDLKDPQKAVPNDPKSKCTIGDYKVDGDTVSWTVDCPQQQTKGNGQITFTDSSYSGWMKMTVGEQEMKTKYSGKWLGECTK